MSQVIAPIPQKSYASRLFALIPAAGRSRRMGSPKLLLPWGGTTVIEHLLATLARPEICAVFVVVRPTDFILRATLARTAAIVIAADQDPPDMRDSVELGLTAIQDRLQGHRSLRRKLARNPEIQLSSRWLKIWNLLPQFCLRLAFASSLSFAKPLFASRLNRKV